MTPELHAMLVTWLDAGDETQRRHAAARLAMPDAIGYEPPPGWAPAKPIPARPNPARIPLDQSIRGVRLGLRNCFYASREGCGCSGATCHHLGRVVTLPDCLSCLK